jgi:hypothetical protein
MQVFLYLRSERLSLYVKLFKKGLRDDDDDVLFFFFELFLIKKKKKLTHIIVLKKINKINYTNIKTYESIAFLNIFDKALKSIITQRINDLTKTQNLFLINQMNKRKNHNCETTWEIFIDQIHTIWNINKN